MAKSRAFKAYASQVANVSHFDERSQLIIEKAKKFDIPLFQNEALAKMLLSQEDREVPSREGSEAMCQMLMWILEAEVSIQMSKE